MNLQSKTFRPGESIFHENDRSRELYILQKGTVKVYRIVSGREVELAILGKGAVLGEMALIDGRPRSASAKALDDCLLTIIGEEAFRDRVRGVPPWFMALIKMTCRKIRRSNRLLHAIGKGRHGINIILALEYLFAKQGGNLDPAETRRLVHRLLGASEQNTGRICEFLHQRHFIDYSESSIRLFDKNLFSNYCDFLRLHIRKFFSRTAPPTAETRGAILALEEKISGMASGAESPGATFDIGGDDFRKLVEGLQVTVPIDEVMAALEAIGILNKAGNKENPDEKADPRSQGGGALQVNTARLKQWYLYFFFADMVPCL